MRLIFRLVEGLLNEQALVACRLQQTITGNPDPNKKKYLESAIRLKNKVQEYGNIGVMDYLRGVTHCMISEDSL